MSSVVYHRSSVSTSSRPCIRLLVILEANTVTGPAKNLLEFCRISRNSEVGPILDTSILLFQRAGVTPSPTQPTNEFAVQAMREGIQVHYIPERYAFDRKVIRSLQRIVDQFAPDIIQTHGLKSHLLVRLSGTNKKRAWVAFHHGYTSRTWTRDLLAHLDRWSLRAPSQVITVSEAFARQLSARGIPRCRIRVLHNAVDPDWVELNSEHRDVPLKMQDDARIVVPRAERLVLAVGRLSREKGFIDLIAAIRHLNVMRPKLAVRLAIVGEGPERKAIERAIRIAKLDDQVQLVGQVKDVRPYYRAASVLAISSHSEGSPNVLLEAMAAGVPVVACEVGGIPEIACHGETALLVPAHDPVSLAIAIDQLLCDHHLAERTARRAKEFIKTHHSPGSRTRSLIELYERLYSSNRITAAQAYQPKTAAL